MVPAQSLTCQWPWANDLIPRALVFPSSNDGVGLNNIQITRMLNAWIKRELIYVGTHDSWWAGLAAPRQILWDHLLFCFVPGPVHFNSQHSRSPKIEFHLAFPISFDISSLCMGFYFSANICYTPSPAMFMLLSVLYSAFYLCLWKFHFIP